MTEDDTSIEVIDYKLFPNRKKGQPVGVAFYKVINRLTVNYGSDFFWPFEQNEDGSPSLSIGSALGGISYDLDCEIAAAIRHLANRGWLSENTEVITDVGCEGEINLSVLNWNNDPSKSSAYDLSDYLKEIETELEVSGKAFSIEWYYARVAGLYFENRDISHSSVFNIGILISQMWWKSQEEENALRGKKNRESLVLAEQAKYKKASRRRNAKLKCIARIWQDVKNDKGASWMRMDTNVALEIHARAEKENPPELWIKASGRIVGPDAIRRLLGELRKMKEID